MTAAAVDKAAARNWKGLWTRFSEGVAAALFALMVVGFLIQIISRYVFNLPVGWSLELCSIGYVWVVFWSCNILSGERQQILFDLLYNRLPARRRRVLAIVNTGTLGLVFLAAMPGVVDYVTFLGRRFSMLLRIRMDLVYSCFVIFMLAVIVGAAFRIWRLCGPSWQKHL